MERVDRFFIDTKFETGGEAYLTDGEHHHLSKVVRIREDETVYLVNGKGFLAKAQVTSIEKSKTLLKIESTQFLKPLEPLLSLVLPIMRSSKLEWVIEKGTELGASSFLLYEGDNSKPKSLTPHQIERLKTMTISALKQSERLYLPSIEIYPDLTSALRGKEEILYGDPEAEIFLKKPSEKPSFFVTGPESGFSQNERNFLQKEGKPFLINRNVLRCETAPIAAVSILRCI